MRDDGRLGQGASLEGRDELVAAVLAALSGPSPRVLLVGPPGIGKTTVWSAVLSQLQPTSLLSARCLEVEADLGLVVIADLFAAAPSEAVARLPDPQRRAVDVVLYRDDAGADPIDHRLLGAATHGLLRVLAEDGPVLVAVDDLHWCDPSSYAALTHALHRLPDDRVAVLASSRERRAVPGSSTFDVGGLDVEALHAVVRRVAPDLDTLRVRAIVERSVGNPFFASELARHAVARPDDPRLPRSLTDALLQRLARLSPATRERLVDVAVRGAPGAADADLGDLGDAAAADIVAAVRGRLQFTHPLLAAAIIETTWPDRLREAHRRAAELTTDPVSAVLHRAEADPAAPGLAEELDAAVDIAVRRSDAAGARRLADLALRHTPGGARPALRLLVLAERCSEALDMPAADACAREALPLLADPELRNRAMHVISDLMPVEKGIALLEAAAALPGLSATRRSVTLALLASRLRRVGRLHDAATVLHRALAEATPRAPGWSHLIGLSSLIDYVTGRTVDEAALASAVEGERGDRSQTEVGTVRGGGATAIAAAGVLAMYDDRHAEAIALMAEADALAAAHGTSSLATFMPPRLAVRMGELARARELIVPMLGTQDTLRHWEWLLQLTHLHVWSGASWRAELAQARAVLHPGDPGGRTAADFVEGLGLLLEGEPGRAWELIQSRVEHDYKIGFREPSDTPALAAAIEATARCGLVGLAEELAVRLEEDARALHSRFGAAGALRGRGHIAAAREDPVRAAALFDAAGDAFDAIAVPLEAARARLEVGGLLRRAGQRRRAREALESARAVFARCEAAALRRSAEAELGRIGGRVTTTDDALTGSERQVARLAATGMRNADVARELHLSIKTVEAHLSRAYRKLGITNRTELARAYPSQIEDEGNP